MADAKVSALPVASPATVAALLSVTGAVVGPASAVDNSVMLFNGATGKLAKSGGALGTAAFANSSTFEVAGAAAAAQTAAAADATTKANTAQSNATTAAATDATSKASAAQTAAQTYADGLVVGLLDDRGNYDASVNVFPSAGGSGTSGAILKGDLWTISVAGTLGGVAVTAGDVVRALGNAPAQIAANWVVTETNIGYVAEPAQTTATQLEVEAGSEVAIRRFSPLRIWQAINARLTLGTWISGATDKAAPVDADTLPVSNSAGSNGLVKVTIANMKAMYKTYFDTLYATAAQGTNDRTASGIRTATTVVASSGATAPTAGQVYTATSPTAAAWQTPAAGGGGSPAGAGTEIQYRNGAAFGAAANTGWDATNGRLGIGTTAPTGVLDLRGSDSKMDFNQELYMQRSGDQFFIAPAVNFKKTRGTVAAPTAPLSGDYGGDFFWRTNTNAVAAGFGGMYENASLGMYIHFDTSTTANSLVEAARFTGAGDLGVGSGASTAARLHVVKTTQQMRVGYDLSNYMTMTVGVAGGTTIGAAGTGARFDFTSPVGVPTATPASATAAGVMGTITWDANYVYVCTATNTWRRVAIAAW